MDKRAADYAAKQGAAALRAAEDPVIEYMTAAQLEKSIKRTRKLMQEAAANLDFAQAAQYRDEMFRLEAILKEKQADTPTPQ